MTRGQLEQWSDFNLARDVATYADIARRERSRWTIAAFSAGIIGCLVGACGVAL